MTIRLLLELLLIASDISGLPIPEPMPAVRVASAEAMPCTCAGAYLDGVLWLREDLDLQQPFGRSVIVHELTHHLQAHELGTPRDAADRFGREVAAIEAQNRYLRLTGSATRAGYTHRSDE